MNNFYGVYRYVYLFLIVNIILDEIIIFNIENKYVRVRESKNVN